MTRIRNLDRLQAKLVRISRDADNAVTNAIRLSVGEMEGYAVRKIQRGGSTGRSYKRGSITHIASSPGQFPNTDTGGLVKSIFSRASGLVGVFGSENLNYAGFLEFGTSKMAARPWLRPTWNFHKDKINKRIRDAVKNVLR